MKKLVLFLFLTIPLFFSANSQNWEPMKGSEGGYFDYNFHFKGDWIVGNSKGLWKMGDNGEWEFLFTSLFQDQETPHPEIRQVFFDSTRVVYTNTLDNNKFYYSEDLITWDVLTVDEGKFYPYGLFYFNQKYFSLFYLNTNEINLYSSNGTLPFTLDTTLTLGDHYGGYNSQTTNNSIIFSTFLFSTDTVFELKKEGIRKIPNPTPYDGSLKPKTFGYLNGDLFYHNMYSNEILKLSNVNSWVAQYVNPASLSIGNLSFSKDSCHFIEAQNQKFTLSSTSDFLTFKRKDFPLDLFGLLISKLNKEGGTLYGTTVNPWKSTDLTSMEVVNKNIFAHGNGFLFNDTLGLTYLNKDTFYIKSENSTVKKFPLPENKIFGTPWITKNGLKILRRENKIFQSSDFIKWETFELEGTPVISHHKINDEKIVLRTQGNSYWFYNPNSKEFNHFSKWPQKFNNLNNLYSTNNTGYYRLPNTDSLFRMKTGSEEWEQISFPPTEISSLMESETDLFAINYNSNELNLFILNNTNWEVLPKNGLPTFTENFRKFPIANFNIGMAIATYRGVFYLRNGQQQWIKIDGEKYLHSNPSQMVVNKNGIGVLYEDLGVITIETVITSTLPNAKLTANLYPNPNLGHGTIELDGINLSKHTSISIRNILGQIVFQQKAVLGLNFFDISNPTPGVHILSVEDNGSLVFEGKMFIH
jgi:hypothetical protein